MTAALVEAVGDRSLPIAVTATADHVVVRVSPAARRLLGDVVGRPIRDALPHAPLLAALDAAHRHREPGAVPLPFPDVMVACVPVPDGVLLLLAPVDAPPELRRRTAALQRLAAELSAAASASAIAFLVSTTAARLLGAEATGVYSRTDAETLTALHASGWPAATAQQYARLELTRGRPLSDAVLDGAAVWLENAEQWRRRYPEMAPIGTSSGFQATACLPLRVQDRDLGAVVFSFLTPRLFTADEREYLLAIAALCAQALDRVRLLAAERAARAAAERQLDRMTFLARAARLMEAPLSVDERLQRLADLAVPDVADWCAVHLVRGDRVEQVAVAHSDPAKLAFVARLQQRYPPDPDAPGGAIQVSRTGRSAFLQEIPDALLVDAAVDEEHLRLIRSIGLRSAVVVPLLVRGRSLGALTLVHAESGQRFEEADLAFTEQLAGVAAVALDNARLYEEQYRIAQTLQDALLPAELPEVPGVRLAARYRPQTNDRAGVHVGGDLYDVVAGDTPDTWALVVADVCGKGPEAAARTALIRHTLRAEVDHGRGPAEVLHRVNRAMLRETGLTPFRFATVAHARLTVDGEGATVTMASAGHLPPLVRRGGCVEAVSTPGTVLGVYPDIELTETTIRLDRGDIMVFYTDGVTEARDVNGFYGNDRLTALTASVTPPTAEALADALLADVLGFQQGRLRDDVALLVLEVGP
jgi:serine phosphatase RsbU (regulator of sigma subunit)